MVYEWCLDVTPVDGGWHYVITLPLWCPQLGVTRLGTVERHLGGQTGTKLGQNQPLCHDSLQVQTSRFSLFSFTYQTEVYSNLVVLLTLQSGLIFSPSVQGLCQIHISFLHQHRYLEEFNANFLSGLAK